MCHLNEYFEGFHKSKISMSEIEDTFSLIRHGQHLHGTLRRRTLLAFTDTSLQWRHNGPHGVPNHQPRHCLPNRLFGRRSKKTSKLRATGLCAGNSALTGEFPAQMASNAENDYIWSRHHVFCRINLTHCARGINRLYLIIDSKKRSYESLLHLN